MIERIAFAGSGANQGASRWTLSGSLQVAVASGKLEMSGNGATGGVMRWGGYRQPALNGEMSGEFTLSSTTQTTLVGIVGAHVSANAATEYPSGFGLMITTGNALTLRSLDASGTVLASWSYTMNTTDRFRFRIQRVQGRVRAKVWNATTGTEPAWQADVASQLYVSDSHCLFAASHFSDAAKTQYLWIQFDDFASNPLPSL